MDQEDEQDKPAASGKTLTAQQLEQRLAVLADEIAMLEKLSGAGIGAGTRTTHR